MKTLTVKSREVHGANGGDMLYHQIVSRKHLSSVTFFLNQADMLVFSLNEEASLKKLESPVIIVPPGTKEANIIILEKQ